MPRFLRVIREKFWHTYPDVDWLQEGELQADALADLKTTEGRLSVFDIGLGVSPERIAIAIAATRSDVEEVEYRIFDSVVIQQLGLTFAMSSGETPDDQVNKVHCDIQMLTTERLSKFAMAISNIDTCMVVFEKIERGLADGVQAGRLKKKYFHGNLWKRFGSLQ